MKNKIIISATATVVIGLFLLALYHKSSVSFIPNTIINNPEIQTTKANEVKKDGPIKTGGLRVPFDYLKRMSDESRSLVDVDTDYGKLTFVLDGNHARNQGYFVFVDGQPVGTKNQEVGGEGYTNQKFSPNKQYYSFVSRGQLGCCDFSMDVNIIDLKNKILIPIRNPENEKIFPYDSRVDVSYFIDSIVWENDDTALVTGFFVAAIPTVAADGTTNQDYKEYRISPRKLWAYSISNNAYTLKEEYKEGK